MEKDLLERTYGECMKYVGANARHVSGLIIRILYEYERPWRHYHGIVHIMDGIRLMDRMSGITDDIFLDRLSYIYHDIVCVPGAKDNEEKSAAWAERDLAACGVYAPYFRDGIRGRIMATTHKTTLTEYDEQFMADVDIAGLGACWKKYALNSGRIRQEYVEHGFSEEEWNAERKAFLESMLARDHVYYLEPFKKLFEKQARENILRSLETLGCAVS